MASHVTHAVNYVNSIDFWYAYKILYFFYVDIIVVLCVAGRSKDVEDHSGETPKPKAHNNQGEKGEIIYTLYCQTGYLLLCL